MGFEINLCVDNDNDAIPHASCMLCVRILVAMFKFVDSHVLLVREVLYVRVPWSSLFISICRS